MAQNIKLKSIKLPSTEGEKNAYIRQGGEVSN